MPLMSSAKVWGPVTYEPRGQPLSCRRMLGQGIAQLLLPSTVMRRDPQHAAKVRHNAASARVVRPAAMPGQESSRGCFALGGQ